MIKKLIVTLGMRVKEMNNSIKQIKVDVEYLSEVFNMDEDAIDDILRACEDLGGMSAEYFCEEFIFTDPEGDIYERWHDDDYLKINWSLQ